MDPAALPSCCTYNYRQFIFFHYDQNQPFNSKKHPLLSDSFFAKALRQGKRHALHSIHHSTKEAATCIRTQRQTNARHITCSALRAEPSNHKDSEFEALEHSRKSRAEIFLEVANQKAKLEEDRRNEELGMKKAKPSRIKVAKVYQPCCYGCGAGLQILQPDTPGYVSPETYALKKKHHQLKTILCGRCRLMTHGHMIPAVGGHGGHVKSSFVSAEELRARLVHIRHQRVLVIKLVDVLDFSGSFLTRVRDLVGANPIILVVTKVDLLPKGTDMMAVGDWVIQATLRKKLKVISVHLASAKTGIGIAGVCAEIHAQRQGRDVYILGSANVGKSTFINALLKMARRDYIAAAAQKYKPIQSAMPGTTIGIIPINAFSGGGSLIDTPGVHLHHRIQTAVEPKDLPLLAPRGRVRTQIVSSPDTPDKAHIQPELTETADHSDDQQKTFGVLEDHFSTDSTTGLCTGLVGTTLFWGGVVRIDVLKASRTTKLIFFGPNVLPIITMLTREADAFYHQELGKSLFPPSAAIEEGGNWSGLLSQHHISLAFSGENRPAGDIAISGLGWVAVHESSADNDVSYGAKAVGENVNIIVHTPKAVEIFVRPSIPVGIDGSRWYKYVDLSEEQEQSLPKLFCYK
ncbi:hypothetical protein O6H91_14G079500 [Diphasiastrum complanatum]|uniref:Uncharacterized protein n=1 Tax=Diphasiastrum complanatum TaxID=34168 RepID=A0ACC2BR45_DIPCM|nr:hypothetical protein O6H91_14G079500 [Diphasiastrum complanatum]